MTKSCFKCGVSKPLSEFYRHPMMADGHLGKCKDCTRSGVKANREQKIGYYRAYDKARHAAPSRRLPKAEKPAPWRETHPDWHYTHRVVALAIKAGKLTPHPCWVCGRKAVAHHADYSRPLDVVWLCESHHRSTHALLKTPTL